jgi:hypothetical protein
VLKSSAYDWLRESRQDTSKPGTWPDVNTNASPGRYGSRSRVFFILTPVFALTPSIQVRSPMRECGLRGPGCVEGVTRDYVRHGTTTLFAELDITTGTVFTECKPRTGIRNSKF